MKKVNNTIVITPGEPAGVGPDLLIQLAQYNWPIKLVACCDPNLLKNRANQLGLELSFNLYSPNIATSSSVKSESANNFSVLPIKLPIPVKAGQLNKKNSIYVINTLRRACDGCINGEFSALVTGPIQKSIINDAGISFTGHTEFLAERSKVNKVVMMLATKKLRIALATTHLPIKNVPKAINFNNLQEVIYILNNELQHKFNIKHPIIYICGLNPHAGEEGYIGHEEIDIIIPVINKLKAEGLQIYGPFPADSIFQRKYITKADVILAMYHDQGLPVLKYQGFGQAVNITLGLPFIRTSVDHGTALNLAGTKKANANSLITALKLAIKMLMLNNKNE